MKKIKILFIAATILFVFVFNCFSESIVMEKESVDKILEKQSYLEKKIEELEKQLNDNSSKTYKGSDISILQEDVEEVSERLDIVETKTFLDRVQITGELRLLLESWHSKDMKTITGKKTDEHSDEIWTSTLYLNLRSDVTKNLIFHSRLQYFKFWGDTYYDGGGGHDWDYASNPKKEGYLHVQRAYFDYFVPNTPISVTMGRMPSGGGGPPDELRYYTTKKSTWPKLMNDVESDGIILNLSLEKLTNLDESMIRIAYVKLAQNYVQYKGIYNYNDSRVYALSFDTEIPGFNNSIFWISYLNAQDLLPIPDYSLPSPLERKTPLPKSMGWLDLYNLHIQFMDLGKFGIDYFFSAAYMTIHPSDHGTIIGNIPVVTPQGVILVENEFGWYGDKLSGNLGKNRQGHCIFTGFRYELPIELLKNPCIGFEYNHGSTYWAGSVITGSGDIQNKLFTNGDGYEVYYIQPIEQKNLFCRAGWIYLDMDYENPMFCYGNQQKTDLKLTRYYLLFDLKF
ncbi:MAG: DUF3373 family protein [Desulfobacterales bacterium]|nr:DUF3373 family protein [Desulfobacterales bacterium]